MLRLKEPETLGACIFLKLNQKLDDVSNLLFFLGILFSFCGPWNTFIKEFVPEYHLFLDFNTMSFFPDIETTFKAVESICIV